MSRPHHYPSDLVSAYDEGYLRTLHRDEDQLRTLRESRVLRPSQLARSRAALSRIVRRDRHSLTTYPCRLEDRTIGRTTIIFTGGEWVAACAVA